MTADIRRLTTDTVSLLDRLAPDVFDYVVRPDSLARFLACPRHVMFLAVEDGLVIGMASGLEYFHPDKEPHFFINEVGVSPGFQKRGVGRALTHALVKEARARGCVYAWLGTDANNASGQACFGSTPDVEGPQSFYLYEWDLED